MTLQGIVSVDWNGTEYYYLRNAQGDIVKLIDATGTSVVEYTYDTWGKKVTTTGTLAGTLGLFQPFRYRGYVYDWESGFYYLQSRYYDPTTGRFISADVYLTTDQGVIGNNTFAYCGDNPVNRIDSEGQFWIAIAIGVLAGLAYEYVCDVTDNIDDGKTGFEIFIPTSNVRDYVASGIGGGIAAIPGLGFWGTVGVGALGSVTTGFIKGDIKSIGEFGEYALGGAVANGVGYGVQKLVEVYTVHKIEEMPRTIRKNYLRDEIFQNSQRFVNDNLREFARNSLSANMQLIEKNLTLFRAGVYSTLSSALTQIFSKIQELLED